MRRLLNTRNDIALTIVRLALGIVILAHGSQKMLGWFGGQGITGTVEFMNGNLGIPTIFVVLAIAAEFLGGIGLILGAVTRVAAFGVAVVMLTAVAMVHWQNGFFMNWGGTQIGEGIEFFVLALGLAITTMIRGAGALSFDYWALTVMTTESEVTTVGQAVVQERITDAVKKTN